MSHHNQIGLFLLQILLILKLQFLILESPMLQQNLRYLPLHLNKLKKLRRILSRSMPQQVQLLLDLRNHLPVGVINNWLQPQYLIPVFECRKWDLMNH